MSWRGSHPQISKTTAIRIIQNRGDHWCRYCVHFERVYPFQTDHPTHARFHTLGKCLRCGSGNGRRLATFLAERALRRLADMNARRRSSAAMEFARRANVELHPNRSLSDLERATLAFVIDGSEKVN